MAFSSWFFLGIFSLCFHTLLSIPLLIWSITFVWRHQNETFFKSRKKLLIKIILIFSVFMIAILRPIELMLGPFRSIIFHHMKIPNFIVTWFTFITTNTSSFIVIQLYVLRAWIYFFNIQSVLALQDKLWEKTLYSTNYDNWYLKSTATYGNVKFCSGIISIFSIFFIIVLCVIRFADSHSSGYIAVIFGFQCLLLILFIILSIVIANIYAVNDLFALRNELKVDLIVLFIVFIILSCVTSVFWNKYEIIWFAFLELTSLLQLIQSVMPMFWYFRVQHKYSKKQKQKRTKTIVASKSPEADQNNRNSRSNSCTASLPTDADINIFKVWWLSVTKQTLNKNDSNRSIQTANHHAMHPKSLKFEDVVCDPRGFREFIKFLSLSFSSENMLFIAEVMRFKNFILMRGLVSFQDVGYYLDLPSNVIDFMWYIPEEYRNVNHAKKARKKRRSSVLQNKKRHSFSLAARLTNSGSENKTNLNALRKNKSCPAPQHAYQNTISVATPEPDDITYSKHQQRMQWMNQQRNNEKKKSSKLTATRSPLGDTPIQGDDDIDLGVISDIEDNDGDFVIVSDQDDDDESISLQNTPKITAMIAPNLLHLALNTMDKTTDDDDGMVSSQQSTFRSLNDEDLPSDNAYDELTRDTTLRIDDFFDGFCEKEINEIIITPLEDAQRIRDRYIANGAEYQINLSGGIQWQTLQSFCDDPKDIDWKSKMLARQQNKNGLKHLLPPVLINVATTTMTPSAAKTSIKACTPSAPNQIANIDIHVISENKTSDDRNEDETCTESTPQQVKMEEIISRFDAACDAIIKQLLLHEFDRFRNTDDYMAYFKSFKKSRKRLGSIAKKIQKKTSKILPSNHHQSPQLVSVNQWSLHKQASLRLNNTPKLSPLKMNKAKSATLRSDKVPYSINMSKRNSYTAGQRNIKSLKSRHMHLDKTQRTKRDPDDFSHNLSSTYSGVFGLLNSQHSTSAHAPQTPQSKSTNNNNNNSANDTDLDATKHGLKPIITDTKETPVMYNKLSLIREQPDKNIADERANLHSDVITPMDTSTPVVIMDDYDAYSMDISDDDMIDDDDDDDNNNEEKEQDPCIYDLERKENEITTS